MLHAGLSLWRKLVRNRISSGPSRKSARRSRRREWPAAVERLEDRTLLSGSNVAPVIDLNGDNGGGVDYATTFTEDLGPIVLSDADMTLTDTDGGVSGGGTPASGDLFAINNNDGTVVRIDPSTGTQTAVGNTGTSFSGARGMAFDPATGDLFVADVSDQVIKVDPTTGTETIVSIGLYLAGDPWDVEFDANGDLIASNATITGSVIRINPVTGAQDLITSGSLIGQAAGLAIEADGSILVGSFSNGTIVRVNPSTGAQSVLATGISVPDDITVAANGDILVADRFAGIYRVNPTTGAKTLLASGGNLVQTHSAVVDADGNIFTTNHTGSGLSSVGSIVQVDPGTGGQSLLTQGGSLSQPWGAAIGSVTKTDTIVSATVTITNLNNVADESLTADTTGTNITASYASGVLSLTGADTAENYQTVLRTVTYNNASQDPDPTPRIITFTANDGIDESDVATATVTVVPVNDLPVINDGDLSLNFTSIDEGGSVTLTGSFADPDFTQTHSVTITWGDGSPDTTINLGAGVLNFTTPHTYLDDVPTGTPWDLTTIHVTVDDGTATDCASTSLTVNNVAPNSVVTSAAIQEYVLAVGESAVFAGTFGDVGTQDTHTALWTFTYVTDAATQVTITDSTATVDSNNGTVTLDRSFDAAGVYSVTLTVTDDDTGETTSDILRTFVVYDPSAGFVTGGGWIVSPAGAYTADPLLTGTATFGFSTKYHNGQTTPSSGTTFSFDVAGLAFDSTSYDWLVVSGARAQFKGEGTINGAGNYGFLLTVVDGQITGSGTDTFRMKIWDKDNANAIVYDNGLGASDDAAPPTAISGGNIIIHTNGQALHAAGTATGSGQISALSYGVLDPVVGDAIAYWSAAGAGPQQVAALRGVDVRLADLHGGLLGMASPANMMWIDVDAAGAGWGGNGYDLFSAVTHEFGHILGLEHDQGGVMDELLSAGPHDFSNGSSTGNGNASTATGGPSPFELQAARETAANDLAGSNNLAVATLSATKPWTGSSFDSKKDDGQAAFSLDDSGTGNGLLPTDGQDGMDALFADVNAAWDNLLTV